MTTPTTGRCLVLAALAVALLLPGLLAAQPRAALVVGVAAYQAVPPLTNPVNDARDVAASLTRLGFETETVLDPDRAALETAIRRLGTRARGEDAALFYYAGHALEANGRNWLLPRTADIASDRDLRFEALDADGILEQVEGAARVTIVLLDACRDNPFRARLGNGGRGAGAPGLAPVRAAVGTLIAFSTAPGTVAEDGRGRNSPFTTSLLHHIETPGMELRQMMAEVRREVRETTRGRQVPWEHSSLEGAFFFKAAAPPPPAPQATAPAPAAAPRVALADADTLFWDSIRASRDAADFRAYLARFPNGIFADLARNRLVQLGAAPPAPVPPQAPPPPATAPTPPPTAPQTAAPAKAPPPSPAAQPAPTLGPRTLTAEALAAAIPLLPRDEAGRVAGGYLSEPKPRALAVNVAKRSSWRCSGMQGAGVEDATLEGCQFVYGSPCAIVAVDDEIRPWPAADAPPVRDMPNLGYSGWFLAHRMPFVWGEPFRKGRVPQDYAAASGPKAMAIHPWGRVFVATGTPSQREAEETALRRCNDDPSRAGRNGPCFLYAIAGRVVLRDRITRADSVALPAQKVAQPPPLTAEAFAAAVPFVDRAATAEAIAEYVAAPNPKVLAVYPERRRVFRHMGIRTPDGNEDPVLESCQVFFGGPCVLVAVDMELKSPPAGGDWVRRDMPRLAYAGRYDPEMVPLVSAWGRRQSTVLQDYARAPAEKAMAIHPAWQYVKVRWSAATIGEAERLALEDCNNDSNRAGREGPCFLYASGDTVVFPQRRTAPAR